ncbi:MAG: hypothetical protein MUO85_00005 [candidate division Zixibacteria bacterium]|nr:hypothetical protein [candidate division Zixibacteria bacterium]
MKRNSFLKTTVLFLMFLASVALLFSCAKDKTPTGGSGTTQTIVTNLIASPDSTVVGGSCYIFAEVTTGGQIDTGEIVNFSVSPSYVGTLSASADTSDSLGEVKTQFHGNNVGTAYVYASTSDTTASIRVRVISSGVTPGEGGLAIAVDPTVLPANGDTTSEVTITVRDANGLPVTDGTIVRLAAGEKFEDADGDGYYNKDIDQLIYDTNKDGIWNPIGNIPMTAATTSGVATATYTAGLRAGMVYIKATAGSPDDPVTDDATILLIPTTGDSIASIALEPANPTIQVKGTGGIEFVQMTATCYDENGNQVVEGWPVIFSILNGPGGGVSINGSASACTVSTNSSGIAQVTVNSGTISGTINLIARFGSVISNSTRITVCAGPPKFISVGVEPCNIRGFDVVNVEAEVVAVVVDSFGNYVPNGTSVYFTVDEGMITPNSETVEGLATATYRSAPRQLVDDGIAIIIVETAGGTVVTTGGLVVSGAPYSVTFLNAPSSLPASPKSTYNITVGIRDINGNPVIDGFKVDFEATYGNIGDGVTEDLICTPLTYNTVSSKYTSTNLEADYSYSVPDNGIGASERVYATCEGASGSTVFPLTTASTSIKTSSIITQGTIDYGSLGSFSVEIKDNFSNPLGGHRVNVINISNGTLLGSAVDTTNAYGQTNFLFRSVDYDTALKSVNITVADTADLRGGIFLSAKITLTQ